MLRTVRRLTWKPAKWSICANQRFPNSTWYIGHAHSRFQNARFADFRMLHGGTRLNKRINIRKAINVKKKSSKPLIEIWESMTVLELANEMDIHIDDVFEYLLESQYADILTDENQPIRDKNVIVRIALDFGCRSNLIGRPVTSASVDMDVYKRLPADPKDVLPRPPVVTIMGHVDHGKTTLLDSLRKSQIALDEFGGITQHIGAFLVKMPGSNGVITFLDTPGHAAFKAMRCRGASVTDIVVLVVAADDGVMEQTRESIKFARQARVPIIVAINKCDKNTADVERTKRQLLADGVQLEEAGGDVQVVCISALRCVGLDKLEEAILTLAELMSLRAEVKGLAEAVVIESRKSNELGRVCTALVQRGTLRKGSWLVADTAWCRVRELFDEHGNVVEKALPSHPVEVVGWKDELPGAGDQILEVSNEKRLKEVIAHRKMKQMRDTIEQTRVKDEEIAQLNRELYLADRKERLAKGFHRWYTMRGSSQRKTVAVTDPTGPVLPVLIKGDVDGSVDAILDVLTTYNSPKVKLDLIDFSVGDVKQSDVDYAAPCKGLIYCFNVDCPSNIERMAENEGVQIKHFNIIYHLVDDLKRELNARLPEVEREEIVGQGHVLKEFILPGKIPVAGTLCTRGTLSKDKKIRIMRSGKVLFDGLVRSMRHEKDSVECVTVDQEVGIMLPDKLINFRTGDEVICYHSVFDKQEIDWHPPGF